MLAILKKVPLLKSNEQINEYTLYRGRVTVQDKTDGIAKVVFATEYEHNEQPIYKITMNDKKLVFPTYSDPSSAPDFLTIGSVKINFEKENGFITIRELGPENIETILYVNIRNCISDSAYNVYRYLPRKLTLREASQKMQNLSEFPEFTPKVAIYNRHGVAVFGHDGKDYALYWASPCEAKVKKLEAAQCAIARDGSSSVAKSGDGAVDFQHLFGKKFYLNAELATPISLP